jgi:hypothetical protein
MILGACWTFTYAHIIMQCTVVKVKACNSFVQMFIRYYILKLGTSFTNMKLIYLLGMSVLHCSVCSCSK